MVNDKKFRSSTQKVYYEIARDEESVRDANFSSIYEFLPDIDLFDEKRIGIGKELLASLRFIEPRFVFYRRDEQTFLEDPNSFSMRLLPGETLEKALASCKNTFSEINELYGHYNVSMRMINFLILRDAALVRKNNTLVNMYQDARERIDEILTNKEVKRFKIDNLENVKTDNDLLLTKKELAVPKEKINQEPLNPAEERVEEVKAKIQKEILNETLDEEDEEEADLFKEAEEHGIPIPNDRVIEPEVVQKEDEEEILKEPLKEEEEIDKSKYNNLYDNIGNESALKELKKSGD